MVNPLPKKMPATCLIALYSRIMPRSHKIGTYLFGPSEQGTELYVFIAPYAGIGRPAPAVLVTEVGDYLFPEDVPQVHYVVGNAQSAGHSSGIDSSVKPAATMTQNGKKRCQIFLLAKSVDGFAKRDGHKSVRSFAPSTTGVP